MTWYWWVLIAVQVLFDLLVLVLLAMLLMGHALLDKTGKQLIGGLFALAKNVDDRFMQSNKNMHEIAKFLLQIFGTDAPAIDDKPVAPPSGDMKN